MISRPGNSSIAPRKPMSSSGDTGHNVTCFRTIRQLDHMSRLMTFKVTQRRRKVRAMAPCPTDRPRTRAALRPEKGSSSSRTDPAFENGIYGAVTAHPGQSEEARCTRCMAVEERRPNHDESRKLC